MAGIGDVARKAGIKPEQAKKAFLAVLDILVESKGEDKVTIQGFGTFKVKERAPRTARNPKTGEEVDVPAKFIPALHFNGDVRREFNDEMQKLLKGKKKSNKNKEESEEKEDKKKNGKDKKKDDKNKKGKKK